MEIGGSGAGRGPQKLLLRCDLLVLRVEEIPGGCDLGVACRIRDYSIVSL